MLTGAGFVGLLRAVVCEGLELGAEAIFEEEVF